MKRFSGIRHYPDVTRLSVSQWPVFMGDFWPLVSDERGNPEGRATPPGGRVGAFQRLEPEECGSVAFGRLSLKWAPLGAALRSQPLAIRLYHSYIGMPRDFPALNDHALIQIVDSALADVARRSGEWLVCRPGCMQCCVGVFPINQLDAVRLKKGLAELEASAPERAEAIRARARDAVARLSADFPGDPVSGLLDDGDEAQRRFSDFANDEPCPVLDPATGTCELYESRPMTCRVFGPPVRSEDGLGVCDLCFQGATDAEVAACEMKPDPDDLESALLEKLEKASGKRGNTIIAFCLGS